MPSEKDKKFKARTFKVHLTKIRKYLDRNSKVVPVDPKHLGQFEPAMEGALIEHADTYIDELVEPQHLQAAPPKRAADERSNPPGPSRTGGGGGIGGGGGGGGGTLPGRRCTCNPLWKKRGHPSAAWSASRRREIQPLNLHHPWCRLLLLAAPRREIWMKKYTMLWWESCQSLLQM